VAADSLSDEQVRDLLLRSRTWAVVGLGDNPARPAWWVARVLMERGKTVIPVHPTASEVHGQPVARTLAEAATLAGSVDVVDCFVNSDRVGAVVDEAIAVGAGAVWMQLGVIDRAAAARAEAVGLTVVMDRCPDHEFPRLVGP